MIEVLKMVKIVKSVKFIQIKGPREAQPPRISAKNLLGGGGRFGRLLKTFQGEW